jgi:hypothetical protein
VHDDHLQDFNQEMAVFLASLDDQIEQATLPVPGRLDKQRLSESQAENACKSCGQVV